MAIPDEDLVGASSKEAFDSGVHLTGQELPHFLVLGIGLVLTANASDALGVGHEEDGLSLCPAYGTDGEDKAEEGSHRYGCTTLCASSASPFADPPQDRVGTDGGSGEDNS